ncbi:MAG TPA: hypothetical protein VNU97_15830 [Rhizomicrobium sp.]|nr:hypothetical protein [Rhizomicrobium sp.]
MPDINDLIDSIFRGIVFILYNYFYSMAILAAQPLRGSLRLVHRLKANFTYQTQPYVFVFISLFIALALPRYLAHVTNFFASALPGSSDDRNNIQDAYFQAVNIFDPAFLLTFTLACIAMTVILDGFIRIYSRVVVAARRRREQLRILLLYHAGYQAIVITAALTIPFYYFREWAWSGLTPYLESRFIPTFFEVVFRCWRSWHSLALAEGLGVCAFGLLLFLYALFEPFAMLNAFLCDGRMNAWTRNVPHRVIVAVTSALLALTTVFYFWVGAWIVDQVGPGDPQPAVVSAVTCIVDPTDRTLIRAQGVVTDPQNAALLMRPFDVDILLVWDKDTAAKAGLYDPKKHGRHKLTATQSAYFFQPLKATITSSDSGKNLPGYLVNPGHSIWIEATTTPRLSKPLAADAAPQECAISLPNYTPQPIQGFGQVVGL